MTDHIIQEDIRRIMEALEKEFAVLGGKNFLITGADGFLPSYFVDTVAGLNETVLSGNPATIFALSRRPPEGNERLLHLLKNPHVRFLNQDVSKRFSLPAGINYIIHAASKASPKEYLAHPIDTIDANVWGARLLLDYAKTSKIDGFLFTSTNEVYGDPENSKVPISEDYFGNVNPLGERSVYQESKRFGETLSNAFWRAHGIPAKIVRIFHTFGPRLSLNDGRVIPEFMRRCFAGEDLEVIRGGSSVRTFSYISDTIEGAWRVLLLGHPGESYNVGSREEITIDGLAKLFIKIFGGSSRIKFVEENAQKGFATTPQKTIPDLEKIERELGYKSKIPLEAGLFRLKEWYELYGNLSQK